MSQIPYTVALCGVFLTPVAGLNLVHINGVIQICLLPIDI